MLLQFFGRADQGRHVIADHLRHHRAAGRILGDRLQYPAVQPRLGVDPEIFRPIHVRPAVTRHQAPERQVSHVLHRRKREDRLAAVQPRMHHPNRWNNSIVKLKSGMPSSGSKLMRE